MKEKNIQYQASDHYLKEIRIRLCEGEALYSNAPLLTPKDAVHTLGEMMSTIDREVVCVINCDSKLRPISYNIVSIGSINAAIVPVSNVFKSAILSNSTSILLMHNHPSGGEPVPSKEDIDITNKLQEAASIMGIPLIDHIIVGSEDKFYSFKSHHLLENIKEYASNTESEKNIEEKIDKKQGKTQHHHR